MSLHRLWHGGIHGLEHPFIWMIPYTFNHLAKQTKSGTWMSHAEPISSRPPVVLQSITSSGYCLLFKQQNRLPCLPPSHITLIQ